MRDSSSKLIYHNNGFRIYECPRKKEYGISDIDENDKIYRVELLGRNQPTFDDVGWLVYYLIKNKVLPEARERYKKIILEFIEKAEIDAFKQTFETQYNKQPTLKHYTDLK